MYLDLVDIQQAFIKLMFGGSSATYANANYVINTTNESTGHCKVWDGARPTTAGLHIVTYDTSTVLANSIVHCSVVA